MQRESARIDDENRGKSQGGEGSSAEESGMRWQMQIQEDVSANQYGDSLGKLLLYVLTHVA